MNKHSGNLISFDNENEEDLTSDCTPLQTLERLERKSAEQSCFSKVQYFSTPHPVPVYHPDDFIRESINHTDAINEQRALREHQKNVRKDNEFMDSLKEASTLTDHLTETPPLPPKRFRNTSDNSLLWQRLRDAGIIVSHTPKNPFYINTDNMTNVDSRGLGMNGHSSSSFSHKSNPKSLSSSEFFKSRLETIISQSDEIDLISDNLNEFNAALKEETLISTNPFIDTAPPELPKSKSLTDILSKTNLTQKLVEKKEEGELVTTRIKSLSLKDLESLEADIYSNATSNNINGGGSGARSAEHKSSSTLPAANKNRFSCPPSVLSETKKMTKEKIFFSNELFQTSEERNEEVVAFFEHVKEMRKLYRHHDVLNNPGFITPVVVPNNALLDFEVDIFIYTEICAGESKTIKCNLSLTSYEIMLKSVEHFEEDSFTDIEILSNEYIFRIVGETKYLELNVRLCDYVHIQNCIKHGKTIELMITRKDEVNRELARNLSDDLHESDINYTDHFFEVNTSLSVSEQGLSILLETYNEEAAKLIEQVTRTELTQYTPDRLIQVVKAIAMSLATVELLQINDAVNILLLLKAKPSLMRTYSDKRECRDYNEYISPLRFDRGRFHLALEKLTSGVYALIEIYCRAFHTGFELQEIYQNSAKSLIDVYERIDPRTIDDKFTVRIASIHRIPAKWKFMYEQFDMEVSLCYGGKLLCPIKRSQKNKTIIGLFEHVSIRELIEFDIKVKKLPRETKVAFALYGNSTPKKGSDGRTVLGWFTTNAYDYEGYLLSGSKLYGLVANTEFNPVATCATNCIRHHETLILKVDFQLYHTQVLFPQPLFIGCSYSLNSISGGGEQDGGEYVIPEKDFVVIDELFTKYPSSLTQEEKSLIWRCRFGLTKFQHALIYVLASVPSWDSENVMKVHSILCAWTKLSVHAALEFLQADYPDKIVRETAVSWITDITDDDLSDYLPELVQALKYEPYHNSALARFLISRALKCPRIALFLFWFLKYYIGDIQFCQRFQIVLSGFLSICGSKFHNELSLEDQFMVALSRVAKRVKESRDSNKRSVLQTELQKVNEELFFEKSSVRLPIKPGFKACRVMENESSYFSSNAVPLKITLQNCDPLGEPVNFIYKIGDDLRKDLVTILLFRTMNKLWIQEGLDLKMMLYNVLPTGPMTGLIEIVPNSATFREIHVQHGVTGSFKDNSLALWLQRFNSSEDLYHKAIKNFTASAAGYCVATYLLGIGDRHNDNIMLTKNGHLFHIDFNKFMGDVQKFGNIKRDRVPFVLTPDMAYVINNGVSNTPNFQNFIEYCCNAFNIIRRNVKLILNLLGLMVYSGISYLSHKDDLLYLRQALQMHLTENEATMYFTRLIESSLSSRSTQLNFFIHNVAHMKNITESVLKSSNSSALFSFSNQVYSFESDGFINTAHVVDFQKRYMPDKHYVFVINVIRKGNMGPKFVFRRFEDFQELHAKLSYLFNVFSGTILPELPPKVIFGRSQVREVAVRRRFELYQYLEDLAKLPAVWRSEVVYTFLHSYIKDIEEERNFADYLEILQGGCKTRIGGRIKLSLVYKKNRFHILIMHARNLLPRRLQGLADPYVKLYLLPDPIKYTKRKTKVLHKTLNPTFNESIVYDVAMELLNRRVLQLSLWDHDNLNENVFLGGINFYLSSCDLTKPNTDWFELEDIGLGS